MCSVLKGEMAPEPDVFTVFFANSIILFFVQVCTCCAYMFTLTLGVSWLKLFICGFMTPTAYLSAYESM